MGATKQPSEKAVAHVLRAFEATRGSWKWSEVKGMALAFDAFAAEAVKAEREACIEVCAVIADNVDNDVRAPHMAEQGYRPLGIGREIRKHAAAIRARGKE